MEGKKTTFDVTTATVACGDGDMELVKKLFERGCEMNDTCAIYASGGGHVALLKYLRDAVRSREHSDGRRERKTKGRPRILDNVK